MINKLSICRKKIICIEQEEDTQGGYDDESLDKLTASSENNNVKYCLYFEGNDDYEPLLCSDYLGHNKSEYPYEV